MARKKRMTVAELEERLLQAELENAKLRGGDSNYGIRLDEYIEVMSLVPYKLNLSTEKLGRGRSFSFSSFGEVKRILYNDLASIFENYRSFMEQGLFYILNEKVIRKHGLDDIYDKILTKEKIEDVINANPKNAVKLYEHANSAQRETINGMIVKKLKEGEVLDLNVIAQISKMADKDLVRVAQEARELDALSMS